MACPAAVTYRPRNARASPLYQLVQDHFEELRAVYSFAASYGPSQERWQAVAENSLRCGDPHIGFARGWCFTCKHTYMTTLRLTGGRTRAQEQCVSRPVRHLACRSQRP